MTNATRTMIETSFTLSGKELCRLMRVHGVTISELAERTGFTLALIRERRTTGVRGFVAFDWTEAITGSLTPRMKAALQAIRHC
jgi:hypothetical protein